MSSNAIAWTNLKAAAITACAARGDSKLVRDYLRADSTLERVSYGTYARRA